MDSKGDRCVDGTINNNPTFSDIQNMFMMNQNERILGRVVYEWYDIVNRTNKYEQKRAELIKQLRELELQQHRDINTLKQISIYCELRRKLVYSKKRRNSTISEAPKRMKL